MGCCHSLNTTAVECSSRHSRHHWPCDIECVVSRSSRMRINSTICRPAQRRHRKESSLLGMRPRALLGPPNQEGHIRMQSPHSSFAVAPFESEASSTSQETAALPTSARQLPSQRASVPDGHSRFKTTRCGVWGFTTGRIASPGIRPTLKRRTTASI
jgi:hypothetical protein